VRLQRPPLLEYRTLFFSSRALIPWERLFKALPMMARYVVGSDRMSREQADYNLLSRWFLYIELDEGNRDRRLKCEIVGGFFRRIVVQAQALSLFSNDQFTIDGTLIEACALLEANRPEPSAGRDDPCNPTGGSRGERLSHCVS
jgi:transposase